MSAGPIDRTQILHGLQEQARRLAARLAAEQLDGDAAAFAILEAFVAVRMQTQDETLELIEARLQACETVVLVGPNGNN